MNKVIIDVREKDEFDFERVEDAIHIPLSQWTATAPNILKGLAPKPVVLMCKSGKRAALALEQLKGVGISLENCSVYEGGITAWKNAGHAVVTKSAGAGRLPIMQQVQIGAGSLVLGGSLLAFGVSPKFLALPAFVGAGLMFAGITGFCGMAVLLSKMPWNR